MTSILFICKLAGALFVISGGGIAGFSYAYKLRKRLDNLRELERIVIHIENDIRYRHSIISEAFRGVSVRCRKPFSDWLMFLSERLDDADSQFSEIWDSSLIYLKDNSFLHNEDIDNLKTLGQTLGYLDIASQEMGIKLFLENLHNKINEISSTLNDKIRISIIAGMVGGIFIVVLLV
ncbi:MAG: stage III sporulation protein AB [Lachnospiraceae bacterium]|nr:stage III sporulation protein AB [Lachnospiraceae bacterium]